jgi:hypothetical protein
MTDGDIEKLVERLRKLRSKATPGEWYADTEQSDGEYGSGPNTRSGFDAYLICVEGEAYSHKQRVLFDSHNSTCGMIEEEYDEDGGSAWDAVAKANATLIVEAVNALPTLLATIEALARDKERLEEALTEARGWLSGWASAEPQIAIIDAALSPTNRDDGEVQDGK